ncbi:uncharacterized protein E0L32_012151 [Thyridium curvatum]|uniref:MHYT domain-containing protein n=1 Tax=Thyridium curvatum TaxID=1093900 RepID=A0A507BLL2_9PEZI|nr:uncharacterized protein E0L32_012151 [Thyridium curvatum]TPX17558.1 hypothetical protein E0L32_012151 [Thyridium curvatum]
MSVDDLLRQYQGHIVSQNYNAGFIALSYLVSFVGSASTLELINRRTGSKGFFNQLTAPWHFIGNRAIDLANGEPELQVAYSSGFTAVSFFVPIVVLLAAFIAFGTNNHVSWWRITVGSILCGAAICGMHYLGNASINNYKCIYQVAFIIGAAIIAVFASFVALSAFFVFRGIWANSWWKRALSAIVLAGAVSGMHWCAVVGTRYLLVDIKPKDNEPSRNATVIVVICLSLAACFIIASSAIYRARKMRKSALRAQQITLGTAVFDTHGRVLVDADGLIPSAVVTDSFLEKSRKEGFNNTHPVFNWMFRASRNWGGISTLLVGMKHHLLQLSSPSSTTADEGGIQLINEHGEMVENYDIIFRELFCVAAMNLAERLRLNISSIGVLWDEILPTGACRKTGAQSKRQHQSHSRPRSEHTTGEDQGEIDLAEKGLHDAQLEYGRGSLMFLVHRVQTSREAERLASAGYRFAELHQVSNLIQTSMQIQSADFESVLRVLELYADQDRRPSGVHVGFFAIRARVDSRGFDVLVPKGARHLLPSQSLHLEDIQRSHVEFLRHFEGMTVSSLVPRLLEGSAAGSPPKMKEFAKQMGEAIKGLRLAVKEPLFEQAVLSPTILRLPSPDGDHGQMETVMITLRLVVPIHSVLSSPDCELIPLSVLKMHQISGRHHQEFAQEVHREFGPFVKTVPPRTGNSEKGRSWPATKLLRLHPGGSMMNKRSVAMVTRKQASLAPTKSSSTVNLCQPDSSNRSRSVDTVEMVDEAERYRSQEDWNVVPQSYGGILVSKEVTINIQNGQTSTGENEGTIKSQSMVVVEDEDRVQKTTSRSSSIELQPMSGMAVKAQTGLQVSKVHVYSGSATDIQTYVDILFADAMGSR